MVRKKLKISTASDALTTASVVAFPTPTAPSRAVYPLWQLINTISKAKQNAFDNAMAMSRRDHDHRLRTQTNLNNLIQEQPPPNLLREDGSKSISRQHHDRPHVSEKGDHARAERGDESSHERESRAATALSSTDSGVEF